MRRSSNGASRTRAGRRRGSHGSPSHSGRAAAALDIYRSWDAVLDPKATTGEKIKAVSVASLSTVSAGLGIAALALALTPAGPFMLAGAIGVGLVSTVVENWDTIKEYAGKAWDGVKNVASAAALGVKNMASSAWNGAKSLFSGW